NAVMRWADVMIEGGRPKMAEDVLAAVVKLTPANSKALTLLGKAEIAAMEFPAASQHLGRAAALQPDSPEIPYLQPQLENEQGNVATAVPLLKKSSQLAPDSRDVLVRLGMTAIKANQPKDAVEAAEKLLTLKPNDPDGLYVLGAASLQGGNLPKAQASLEQYV